jgi:hypothetical protein
MQETIQLAGREESGPGRQGASDAETERSDPDVLNAG